jgi:hypothetical protein
MFPTWPAKRRGGLAAFSDLRTTGDPTACDGAAVTAGPSPPRSFILEESPDP